MLVADGHIRESELADRRVEMFAGFIFLWFGNMIVVIEASGERKGGGFNSDENVHLQHAV